MAAMELSRTKAGTSGISVPILSWNMVGIGQNVLSTTVVSSASGIYWWHFGWLAEVLEMKLWRSAYDSSLLSKQTEIEGIPDTICTWDQITSTPPSASAAFFRLFWGLHGKSTLHPHLYLEWHQYKNICISFHFRNSITLLKNKI